MNVEIIALLSLIALFLIVFNDSNVVIKPVKINNDQHEWVKKSKSYRINMY